MHHVGQKGADEDFKKTVYKVVSIQTVERNVPVSHPHRDELLNQLKREFPSEGGLRFYGTTAFSCSAPVPLFVA